jgi:hypothetical protein
MVIPSNHDSYYSKWLQSGQAGSLHCFLSPSLEGFLGLSLEAGKKGGTRDITFYIGARL